MKNYAYRVITIFSLVILTSCTTVTGNQESVTSNSYPNRSTCSSLKTSKWQTTNLYDLTYGCIPTGWESFFMQEKVKTKSKQYQISSKLKLTKVTI